MVGWRSVPVKERRKFRRKNHEEKDMRYPKQVVHKPFVKRDDKYKPKLADWIIDEPE